MEVAGYFIIIQISAFIVSLITLLFAFNTNSSRRALHGIYFSISILVLAASLLVLLPLLQVGGLTDAVDFVVEFLPLGLTLAIAITTAIRSFKFLGTQGQENANT